MSVLTSGATFKSFYNDEAYWDNFFHDDVLLKVDGSTVRTIEPDQITDESRVEIVEGGVCSNDGDEDFALEDFFNQWLAKQTHTVLLVRVPADKLAAVRLTLEQAGCEVC